jgi:molybdopterin converting factor small subunit
MSELTVHFFARLREELGHGQLTFTLGVVPMSVDQVMRQLVSEHGAQWARVLEDDNLVIAVNQRVCSRDTLLSGGEELAVFPPVTGG